MPNLLCAILLVLEAIAVHFLLIETLASIRNSKVPLPGPMDLVKKFISRFTSPNSPRYALVDNSSEGLLAGMDDNTIELSPINGSEKPKMSKRPQVLPFSRIWTANVLWVLLSIAIFDFHMGCVVPSRPPHFFFLAANRVCIVPSPAFGSSICPLTGPSLKLLPASPRGLTPSSSAAALPSNLPP